MVDRFEKFSAAMVEISRYWHRIADSVMAQYGLKGTYAVYFTALYRSAGGLTAVQLGELCCRDKADVSRALTVLAREGFIQKECDGQRLYRAQITLTDSGKAAAGQIMKSAQAAVDYVGKDLNQDSRMIFYRCLDSIVSNLQALSKEGLTQS